MFNKSTHSGLTSSQFRKTLPFLLLLALSTYGCSIMVPSNTNMSPNQEKSVINFIKKGKTDGNSALWLRDHFIGIMEPDTIIQHELPTGHYLFIAVRDNQCTFLSAELKADKSYAVLIQQVPALGELFLPINGKKMTNKIHKWFSKYPFMVALPKKALTYEKRNVEEVRKCRQSYEKLKRRNIDFDLPSNFFLIEAKDHSLEEVTLKTSASKSNKIH